MTERGVRLVLTTAPDAAVADTLVRTLVEERLVACGNIVPGVTSVYRWKGHVQSDAEVLVLLKTSEVKAEAVVQRIAGLHPYDVPEALVIDVAGGLPAYLGWIHESTTEVDEG